MQDCSRLQGPAATICNLQQSRKAVGIARGSQHQWYQWVGQAPRWGAASPDKQGGIL